MLGSMISFLMAHEVVLAGLGIAILDLVFALSPGLESNGILHFIFLQLQGLVAPKQG